MAINKYYLIDIRIIHRFILMLSIGLLNNLNYNSNNHFHMDKNDIIYQVIFRFKDNIYLKKIYHNKFEFKFTHM